MFNFFKSSHKADELNSTEDNLLEDFNDVGDIARYFKSETGVTFENQTSILKSKLISFCRNNHLSSFNECLTKAKLDNNLRQALINYLTTNETYFYREISQINDLVRTVVKNKSKVNILCAPCSSGEESYSLVIALLEAGVNENQFSVLGIDINTEALIKAQAGQYSERNVSRLPPELRHKYFTPHENLYALEERIKSQVAFKSINIFDPQFILLGKFDYIFSRNMLIYFDKETKEKAKKILLSMLKNNETNIFFGHADLF